MVLSALGCGCLQGLAFQRSRSRAKCGLVEDEAASYHDEDVQAKINAVHEAKQRQESETKALQELENMAKERRAADFDKLDHAELFGRLEKAKAEMEAKEQPEAANEAVALQKIAGSSPEDVRCLPLEDSNSSLDSTRIESPYAAEMEMTEQPEIANEAAPQQKSEGTSPEDIQCLLLEDSNSSLDSTQIANPCATEMEAKEQLKAAKEAVPQLKKKEGTSPEDVRRLPLEDSNLALDNAGIESPYAAASDDAQAMSTTAELSIPCRSLQGVMEPAATGQEVPDSVELVTEGQHSQVVLQGAADDGAHMTPQPHEKYPGFEPAMEAASLEESSATLSAPVDQLKSSELDEHRTGAAAAAAEAGAGFACKAVLTSCAVVAIAALAFYATSRST